MRRAFTLIEVLLAILVMGLFFSSAFTEQARSVVLESRARLEAAAALQVRCKMSELELAMKKDGFPPAEEAESGPCCEAFEDERFECAWTVTPIELPAIADIQQRMEEDRTDQTLVATGDDQEASSFEEQTQAFLSMGALTQILPVLQTFLIDAIRKAEVTIVWKYRNRVYDFTVTQYLTNPSQGTLGAFLQGDLIQRLMTGGPNAWMELLFGGDESGAGGGTGGTGGGDQEKTP
ncbi:MAG: prepilin-type N-terminal cleavage/methylation domain-containing protein [Deltaproteobacteria bacterium]|nr:prepilin-type N-terminal cleavage/methylation domain-containing protein [Deltaproteobacteria bacterium]